MSTLYVSDLDGTLLLSEQCLSPFTAEAINSLVKKGVNFTFATARSIVTAKKVILGLEVKIPMILHNGSFIVDSETEKRVVENIFDEEASAEVLRELLAADIHPIVYTLIDGEEKFLYLESRINSFTDEFIKTRWNDIRRRPAENEEEMYLGRRYYFTCIDEKEKLEPFYLKYKEKFHCIFQRDIYSGDWWLEFLPLTASKSAAVLQLKEMLGCDKVVCFGDAKNDIDMFRISDECYAVANACEELKAIATGVIGDNNSDSVAKWLLENAE